MLKTYDVITYIQVSICERIEAKTSEQAESLAGEIDFVSANGLVIWNKIHVVDDAGISEVIATSKGST